MTSRGLNGSFVLNPHFDPNDTRLNPTEDENFREIIYDELLFSTLSTKVGRKK